MSLAATPAVLVPAAYATTSDATVYTSPTSTTTIIDKFTVTNNDSSTHTLNVNIIPSGGTVGATNLIVSVMTIQVTASGPVDLTALQNQILAPGDMISVKASAGSVLVVRASGRQCA